MTNKQLQTYLKEFSDNMEVVIYVDSVIRIEPGILHKRFMETSQKDMILIGIKI